MSGEPVPEQEELRIFKGMRVTEDDRLGLCAWTRAMCASCGGTIRLLLKKNEVENTTDPIIIRNSGVEGGPNYACGLCGIALFFTPHSPVV